MKKGMMLALIVFLAAGSCLMADSANSVTVATFRLGEDDAGAAAGNTGNDPTTEIVQGADAAQFGAPAYSSDVPVSGTTLSMAFDGDDWYNVANSLLPAADNYGFEAWAKADALDGFNFLVSSGTNYGGISLVQVGEQMGVLAPGVGWPVPVTYDITLGEWHHYAAVSDGGTVKFYVDGELKGSGANNAKPIQPSFTIGANDKIDGGSVASGSATPTFEGFWKGNIDHVRVFAFEAGRFDPNDLSYNALLPADRVGSVSQTDGDTLVKEGEIIDSFDVVLDSAPTADVTVVVDPNVAISSTSQEIMLNTAGAGESITLTFTTTDWDTPQTVQVTAVDDTNPEPIKQAVVQFVLSSADAAFDGGYITAVPVTVIDDDSAAYGIVETDDDTIVDEEGETSDTFTVALETAPTADVTVTLDELNDPNDVLVSPTTLTFTPADFDTPQTVTVTAIDDADIEAHPHNAPVRLTAASTDLEYDGLAIDVIVSVNENECGAIGYLAADLNEDCKVDLTDFSLFAAEWLQCTFPHIVGCP